MDHGFSESANFSPEAGQDYLLLSRNSALWLRGYDDGDDPTWSGHAAGDCSLAPSGLHIWDRLEVTRECFADVVNAALEHPVSSYPALSVKNGKLWVTDVTVVDDPLLVGVFPVINLRSSDEYGLDLVHEDIYITLPHGYVISVGRKTDGNVAIVMLLRPSDFEGGLTSELFDQIRDTLGLELPDPPLCIDPLSWTPRTVLPR